MSDGFGPDLTDEQLEAGIIADLPSHLRSRTCSAGEPWTGDRPDEDHGHTDCYINRLAANEIERLRLALERKCPGPHLVEAPPEGPEYDF